MASKTCQICGQNSGMYPLCKQHMEDKEKGLIVKNETTGKWTMAKNTVMNTETFEIKWCKNAPQYKNETKNNKHNNCIVCDNPTSNDGWQYLCKDCYATTLQYIYELDRNMNVINYRDYYYNLKQNIYRMTGFDRFIKPNILKLIAIAKANERYNDNTELLNKVKYDVIELIEKKKNKDFLKEEKKVIEHNEKVQKKENRSQDGHFLDSQLEITIDDILFTSGLPHAIHYPVFEITERPVYCDWYIPITQTKGIYIELWGMDKKDYIDNRDEKINLYKKHNLDLIMFDKSELNDTLNIKKILFKKLDEYKNKKQI